MSLTPPALPYAALHRALLAAKQTMLDFNSGYRGGSVRPVSGFGNDNLMIVGLILLLVPLIIGLYYLIKYRDFIAQRIRHTLSSTKNSSSTDTLETLRQSRHELEAFVVHKKRSRFVGNMRLQKVTGDSIVLVVMNAINTSAGFKNCLATLYFPPMGTDRKINCLCAVITSINTKQIVLSRRCRFGYESRRQHFRVEVSDPRYVKASLWLTLPPPEGVGRLEETAPALLIDWQKSSGPRSARVKDVSVTGLGILLPLAQRSTALEMAEPLTMLLKVYNRQTKKFRPLWVAGIIRNRINISNGRVILGIQYTHRGAVNGSPTDVRWEKVDPDHGVPGLTGVLEAMVDQAD